MTAVMYPISSELKQVLRLKLGQLLDTLPERLALAKQQHLSHAALLEAQLADTGHISASRLHSGNHIGLSTSPAGDTTKGHHQGKGPTGDRLTRRAGSR